MTTLELQRAPLAEAYSHMKRLADKRIDTIVTHDTLTVTPTGVRVQTGANLVDNADGDLVWEPKLQKFDFTKTSWSQLNTTLGIPQKFADKIKNHAMGRTYASLANDLMVDMPPKLIRLYERDDKDATLTYGTFRALLSPSYGIFDNIDAMTVALEACQAVGVNEVEWISISETNMRMRIVAHNIAVEARDIMDRYVSPYNRQRGSDLPLLFAGVEIRNSEVGQGSYTIVPIVEVQVCSNGLVRNMLANASRHVGASRLSNASQRTIEAVKELLKSESIDLLRAWMSPEFLEEQVDQLRKFDAVEVNPNVIKEIVALRFSPVDTDAIVSAFLASGQHTALGVLNAVTAYSQQVSVEKGMLLDDIAYQMAEDLC